MNIFKLIPELQKRKFPNKLELIDQQVVGTHDDQGPSE